MTSRDRSKMLAVISVMFAAACTSNDPTAVSPGSVASLTTHDSAVALTDDAATHIYQVRIENLTTGQPFSPGVIVTHTKDVTVFDVGSRASEGIRAIAEDGNHTVAVSELTGREGVHAVVTIDSPIHRIGGPGPSAATFQIAARANANRLSLATMLICTNDGFTGLGGVKLPGGFKPETHPAAGYDAGTEANNERSNQIVDPCGAIGPLPQPADGNGRVPTAGAIAHHPNIQGGADLVPLAHGWRDPVARITIQRLR